MEESLNYVNKDYKERTSHGTILLPLSIHHTYMSQGSEDILYKHWHHECELLIITSGEAIFKIEDQEYHMKESQGLFIPPKCLHSASHVDFSQCEFFAIVFHSDLITDISNSFLHSKYVYPLLIGGSKYSLSFSTDVEWQKKVYNSIYNICLFHAENLKLNELAVKGKLLQIWQDLFNNYFIRITNSSIESSKHIDLKEVFEYINDHYQYEIRLKDLSDILSRSEGQFCKLFKNATGMTPITYITRFRILKSCELLSVTEKKITEIADLTGFNNISYFNRTFKSFLNCSPKTYRRRNSSIH